MKTRLELGHVSIGRMLLAVAMVAALACGTVQPAVAATQIDIVGPAGNDTFGTWLTILPNCNIVVIDPYFDVGATVDVGAVYLYDGATGALISALTGSTTGDMVGWDTLWKRPTVTVLSNGNYLVISRYWDNGAARDAGAVTWASATTGISGAVSAANSLVGSTADDEVGYVTKLSNGNYVVRSHSWDNGVFVDAGAVTWGNGMTGIVGAVSAANSLVGSTADDQVSSFGVTELNNGNYVVKSPYWDNGAAVNAGAVTWGNGITGLVGTVLVANSLVGSSGSDKVGYEDVIALSNGNYVVQSPEWNNGAVTDAGAVTWGNGTTGIVGPVSAANSLVGSTAYDEVGANSNGPAVTALSNGNYVVRTLWWDNGSVVNAGAVTWGSGTTGIKGVVSAANSLVGGTDDDLVGYYGVRELSNGNYVVRSLDWDNGAAVDAGAVTWGSGTTGITGAVSAANSLVGSTADEQVGYDGVTALNNGNYVVKSRYWDRGATSDVGAVTWGNGMTGVSGPVSEANSLVGSRAGDIAGSSYVEALSKGNYVVRSLDWDNGAAVDAGAVTWGNGTTGIIGVVSAANSLVGSTAGDGVGYRVTELSNGNYVVQSRYWDNGAVTDAGAVTWGNGTTGIVGVVSASNSLVGSTAGDQIGDDESGPSVMVLSNGNYVVRSPNWDNGSVVNAGAVTRGNGTTGIIGVVSAANSLVGSTAHDAVGYVTNLSNGNYGVQPLLGQWRGG